MSKRAVKNILGISFILRAVGSLAYLAVILGQKIILPVLYRYSPQENIFCFPVLPFFQNIVGLLLHLGFVVVLVRLLDKPEKGKVWDVLSMVFCAFPMGVVSLLLNGVYLNLMGDILGAGYLQTHALVESASSFFSPLGTVAVALLLIGCTASLCYKAYAAKPTQPLAD